MVEESIIALNNILVLYMDGYVNTPQNPSYGGHSLLYYAI